MGPKKQVLKVVDPKVRHLKGVEHSKAGVPRQILLYDRLDQVC